MVAPKSPVPHEEVVQPLVSSATLAEKYALTDSWNRVSITDIDEQCNALLLACSSALKAENPFLIECDLAVTEQHILKGQRQEAVATKVEGRFAVPPNNDLPKFEDMISFSPLTAPGEVISRAPSPPESPTSNLEEHQHATRRLLESTKARATRDDCIKRPKTPVVLEELDLTFLESFNLLSTLSDGVLQDAEIYPDAHGSQCFQRSTPNVFLPLVDGRQPGEELQYLDTITDHTLPVSSKDQLAFRSANHDNVAVVKLPSSPPSGFDSVADLNLSVSTQDHVDISPNQNGSAVVVKLPARPVCQEAQTPASNVKPSMQASIEALDVAAVFGAASENWADDDEELEALTAEATSLEGIEEAPPLSEIPNQDVAVGIDMIQPAALPLKVDDVVALSTQKDFDVLSPAEKARTTFVPESIRQHAAPYAQTQIDQLVTMQGLDRRLDELQVLWSNKVTASKNERMSSGNTRKTLEQGNPNGFWHRMIGHETSKNAAPSVKENVEDTKDDNEVQVCERKHHINFLGQWCPSKSNTTPAVSYWAICNGYRNGRVLDAISFKGVGCAEAAKRVDPVECDGDLSLPPQLTGDKLRNFVTGQVNIAYKPVGTWQCDQYTADEDVPNHVGALPHLAALLDDYGRPVDCPGLQLPYVMGSNEGRTGQAPPKTNMIMVRALDTRGGTPLRGFFYFCPNGDLAWKIQRRLPASKPNTIPSRIAETVEDVTDQSSGENADVVDVLKASGTLEPDHSTENIRAATNKPISENAGAFGSTEAFNASNITLQEDEVRQNVIEDVPLAAIEGIESVQASNLEGDHPSILDTDQDRTIGPEKKLEDADAWFDEYREKRRLQKGPHERYMHPDDWYVHWKARIDDELASYTKEHGHPPARQLDRVRLGLFPYVSGEECRASMLAFCPSAIRRVFLKSHENSKPSLSEASGQPKEVETPCTSSRKKALTPAKIPKNKKATQKAKAQDISTPKKSGKIPPLQKSKFSTFSKPNESRDATTPNKADAPEISADEYVAAMVGKGEDFEFGSEEHNAFVKQQEELMASFESPLARKNSGRDFSAEKMFASTEVDEVIESPAGNIGSWVMNENGEFKTPYKPPLTKKAGPFTAVTPQNVFTTQPLEAEHDPWAKRGCTTEAETLQLTPCKPSKIRKHSRMNTFDSPRALPALSTPVTTLKTNPTPVDDSPSREQLAVERKPQHVHVNDGKASAIETSNIGSDESADLGTPRQSLRSPTLPNATSENPALDLLFQYGDEEKVAEVQRIMAAASADALELPECKEAMNAYEDASMQVRKQHASQSLRSSTAGQSRALEGIVITDGGNEPVAEGNDSLVGAGSVSDPETHQDIRLQGKTQFTNVVSTAPDTASQHDQEHDDHENEGQEPLSDNELDDDPEVGNCLLSADEVAAKTRTWTEKHRISDDSKDLTEADENKIASKFTYDSFMGRMLARQPQAKMIMPSKKVEDLEEEGTDEVEEADTGKTVQEQGTRISSPDDSHITSTSPNTVPHIRETSNETTATAATALTSDDEEPTAQQEITGKGPAPSEDPTPTVEPTKKKPKQSSNSGSRSLYSAFPFKYSMTQASAAARGPTCGYSLGHVALAVVCGFGLKLLWDKTP